MRIILCCLLSCFAFSAYAVIETYEFSSEALEARYHQLSQELRCPKCQNQNIADSNSPISRDLRALTYEQLEAGATDEEILAFMVERYGEFVRYRPAVDERTALLWYGPAAMVLVGAVVFGIQLRRRSKVAPVSGELSSEERAKLAARLGTDMANTDMANDSRGSTVNDKDVS